MPTQVKVDEVARLREKFRQGDVVGPGRLPGTHGERDGGAS